MVLYINSYYGSLKKRKRKRGRAKIPSPPTPFLFARPSVRFRFCRAERGNHKFRSKNVRAELYNSTNIKLSDFLPTNRRRVAPPHTAKWGFRTLRARPSGGSKSLAIFVFALPN